MPARVEGLPSSWRDFADELTVGQIAALTNRERSGANPGMLLCEALELAARNLDGWHRRRWCGLRGSAARALDLAATVFEL